MLARFLPVRSARGSLPAATVDHSAAPSSPNWLSVSPAAGQHRDEREQRRRRGPVGSLAERCEQRDRGHDQRADERRAPPGIASEVAHVLGRDRADPVVRQERRARAGSDRAARHPRRARCRHRRVGARERRARARATRSTASTAMSAPIAARNPIAASIVAACGVGDRGSAPRERREPHAVRDAGERLVESRGAARSAPRTSRAAAA